MAPASGRGHDSCGPAANPHAEKAEKVVTTGTGAPSYRHVESRLWQSLGQQPTTRHVRLPSIGTQIRVQELGAGAPVIFAHGASNAGSSWAPLVARLAGHRCLSSAPAESRGSSVVVDRPGCGLSDPLPEPFGDIAAFQSFADGFVADVLDAVELDRGSVVATSLGGYLALRSAATTPERIEGMTQFGYCVGAPIDKIPLVMRLSSIGPIGRAVTRITPTRRMIRSLLRQIGLAQALAAGRVSDESCDWFLAVMRDTDTLRNELDANPSIITPLRGMNRHMALDDELLGGIGCHVRFLWGTQDPMGGAEVAQPFVARLPDAELELVPGAGHAPWIDDPDCAAAAVRACVRDTY